MVLSLDSLRYVFFAEDGYRCAETWRRVPLSADFVPKSLLTSVRIAMFSHIFAFMSIFTDGRTDVAMATDASAEDGSILSCHTTWMPLMLKIPKL